MNNLAINLIKADKVIFLITEALLTDKVTCKKQAINKIIIIVSKV